MPVSNPAGAGGGGGGLPVTIDADGYVVVGDGVSVMPFKTVVTEIATNMYRFTRMIKHPDLGETELEITDVEVPTP